MITFIINDAPYGNERIYNALRLAIALAKKGESIRLFLMGDAVLAAVEKQITPNGFYNIGRMVKSLLKREVPVHA